MVETLKASFGLATLPAGLFFLSHWLIDSSKSEASSLLKVAGKNVDPSPKKIEWRDKVFHAPFVWNKKTTLEEYIQERGKQNCLITIEKPEDLKKQVRNMKEVYKKIDDFCFKSESINLIKMNKWSYEKVKYIFYWAAKDNFTNKIVGRIYVS